MVDFSFTPLRTADGSAQVPKDALPPAPGNNAGATLQKSAQNLLLHIPGEASGLYLMAADAFDKPSTGAIIFIAILALIILIVVRWAAGASKAVMVTSVVAFLIWMFVLDKGVFQLLLPDLLPNPLGLIIAVAYSSLITTLGNAGMIK
jgi:hypothetical protein